MPDRALEVVDPGALTTVQDGGRTGLAHLGVPRSGALDLPAHRRAQRLVGNPESAASLETTATGVAFRVRRATTFAVTGAWCPVAVDGRAGPWGAPVTAPAGALVEVLPARAGLRAYVALAGGLAIEPVLGSRSTDLLGGLGPAPLRAGDVLPLGEPVGPPVPVDQASYAAHPGVLGLLPGPRADWCDLALLDGARFRVGPASNRIGLRLEAVQLPGAGAPAAGGVPRRAGELPSEPMVLGAVQLPPDGRPVVLLNDHATTGGYPVVAVVRGSDLPTCAQLRPGEEVVTRLVG